MSKGMRLTIQSFGHRDKNQPNHGCCETTGGEMLISGTDRTIQLINGYSICLYDWQTTSDRDKHLYTLLLLLLLTSTYIIIVNFSNNFYKSASKTICTYK